MRYSLIAATALAAMTVQSRSEATIVTFHITAHGNYPHAWLGGGGQFRLAGEDGIFTLANGLKSFNFHGLVVPGSCCSAPFNWDASVLNSLSMTLDHGTVTALSLDSINVPVPYGGITGHIQFAVSGLNPSNFSFISDVEDDPNPPPHPMFGTFGPYRGTFFIAYGPEPAAWMMMLAGFGLVGCAMHNRRKRIGVA